MQPYCNWVKGVSLGCPMAPGNHIPLRRDCDHLTQYADIFLSCPGPRTPFRSLIAELLKFCCWLGNLEFGCLSDQRLAGTLLRTLHSPTHDNTRKHITKRELLWHREGSQGPLLDVSAAEVVRARLSSCSALSSFVCGGLCKAARSLPRPRC